MVFRQCTEREFVYLIKDLGKYCTFGDAKNVVEAVLSTLKQVSAEKSEMFRELLPDSIQPIWDHANISENPSHSIVELLKSYEFIYSKREAEIALISFFGAIREKHSNYIGHWDKLIPDEIRQYWEQSKNIDRGIDVRQCL